MKQLIHDLGQLVSASGSETSRIQCMADRLDAFLKESPTLDPRFTQPGRDTYGRHLVHRDPQNRFVVVAMAWGPGHCT